jgi:serine/threonine protein kinase
MLDIALGLNYLHTLKPNIIHGDIKGVGHIHFVQALTNQTIYLKVNILITQSLRACLADFGLSAAKETPSMAITTAVITRATGTMRWQAPELMKDDDVCNSLASDVYAYGCVCYEVRFQI